MVKPVLSAEDFKNEVDEKFGMRRMINAMTEYLHEKGKVLCFSQVPSLKDYIFVRPLWGSCQILPAFQFLFVINRNHGIALNWS
jgi:hypothetical protein